MLANEISFSPKSVFISNFLWGKDGITLQLEDNADSAWRFEVKLTEEFMRNTLAMLEDMPV